MSIYTHGMYVLLVVTVGLWCYNIAALTPHVEHLTEEDYNQYLVSNDSGCDEIIAAPNYYTSKTDLVCEVTLQHEDDAVFIVKKEGSLDDYQYKK